MRTKQENSPQASGNCLARPPSRPVSLLSDRPSPAFKRPFDFYGRFFVSNRVKETYLHEAQRTVNIITDNKREETEPKGMRHQRKEVERVGAGPDALGVGARVQRTPHRQAQGQSPGGCGDRRGHLRASFSPWSRRPDITLGLR